MSVSLEVDYCHLIAVHTKLAMWLADVPAPVLETLDQAAMQVLAALHPKYCDHLTDRERIHVRISNLPIVDQIRNIRYGYRLRPPGYHIPVPETVSIQSSRPSPLRFRGRGGCIPKPFGRLESDSSRPAQPSRI